MAALRAQAKETNSRTWQPSQTCKGHGNLSFEEDRLAERHVRHKESAMDRVLAFASDSYFGAFIVALAFLIFLYLLVMWV